MAWICSKSKIRATVGVTFLLVAASAGVAWIAVHNEWAECFSGRVAGPNATSPEREESEDSRRQRSSVSAANAENENVLPDEKEKQK